MPAPGVAVEMLGAASVPVLAVAFPCPGAAMNPNALTVITVSAAVTVASERSFRGVVARA